MTRAARGSVARRQTIKYQAQIGVNKPDDWPGGGIVSYGFTKDDGQWNWWRSYFAYMTGRSMLIKLGFRWPTSEFSFEFANGTRLKAEINRACGGHTEGGDPHPGRARSVPRVRSRV